MISKKQKTLKGSMLVVLLLLMPTMLYAACTGSSPTWTTTPDYASVASCVSQATYGDTINVSAGVGTVDWPSNLSITKDIKLIGPGKSSLTIYNTQTCSSQCAMISYIPDATARARNEVFEVSGFTFTDGRDIVDTNAIKIENTSTTPTRKIKIHDNRFLSIHRALLTDGTVFGVFYENSLDYANFSYVFGAHRTSWEIDPLDKGGASNLYFEDNTINNTFRGTGNVIAGGHGGRYIVRYNTTQGVAGALFDIHGNQPGGLYAMVHQEIYGNDLAKMVVAAQTIDHRGGRLFAFYNEINDPYAAIKVREEYCDSATNTPLSVGTNRPTDSYYWNIRLANGTIKNAYLGQAACPAEFTPTENVHFFNLNTNFNGTTGIGCGPLANRPATCTTGVGYWATNQSCTDMAGMVGANPSTPISGTLYKCTATNKWEPYYTPYTYPHPLRNSTVSYTDNTQEPAPTTSVPPTIAVSPTIKDFGTLPINTSSPAQRFTVTTTGGNLNVDAISMTGTDATQFAIQNDSCTGKIIAPETGSCTFDVKFSPSSVGAKAANVAIIDNDSNTSKLIAVNGTGTSQIPAISFSPTSLFFSGVLSGTLSSPQTIRVSNTSTNFVTISSISLSGTYANQFSIPAATDYCTGETVAASGNCSFQVIFAPTSGGEKTANVNLTALYYSSPATLPLYGSAVVYPAPKIKISRTK